MKKGLEKKIKYGCNLDILKQSFKIKAENKRKELLTYDVQSNQCENSNQVLLAFKHWESVHPLMKVILVAWNYGMPFGLLYSKNPDKKVQKLLVQSVS